MAIKRRKKAEIQELDRTKVRAIHADIVHALQEVGDLHNLDFKVGTVTYEKTSFSVSVKANVRGAKTVEAKTYEIHAKSFDLPPLGTKIRLGSDSFELLGYNSRAPKKPIQMRNLSNGKLYKASVISVVNAPQL